MLLTEEQKIIVKMAQDYVCEKIIPHAAKWDKNKTFPAAALKGLGELGFYGMLVPEEWCGSDIGYTSCALVIEEIAFGDAACSTIISVTNSVGCMPILNFGNQQQKEKFLKPLASGEKLAAFCLTEPHAGSDAADLTTKAVKQGNQYILNGTKQFITSGKNADIAIVFAITDASAGKKGISAFIVPTDTPGYQVASLEDKMGQNASDTAQIVFEDCAVGEENLLGEAGEGYKMALSGLEGGRISIAAQAVGIARAAFETALDYSKDRKAFDKNLYQHQAISFKLAEMATQIEAARALVLKAAALKDQQLPCLKEACMAKLFASQMAEKVCSDAIQIFGGYGYSKEFPLERFYRDVRVCQIYEGTSEIQKLVISREILR